MDYMQGGDLNLIEVEIQVMKDSSSSDSSSEVEGKRVEKHDLGNYARLKSLIDEPPELELKPLPKHLEHTFLGEGSKLPVIIASYMTRKQKDKLLNIIKKHEKAIAWKISDIRGISPSFCTHKILMEENHKPMVIPQQRLNHNMKEVMKNEVVKLIDAGIIYLISDSAWVYPV